MFTVFVVILNFYLALSSPLLETPSDDICQKACHPLVDGKINVHLVPHSHDDVGWLRTYDEYYIGTGRFDTIANAGVQYIINSTIQALSENPDRRFIQVETAFFYKWWNEQNEETRNVVREMINKGQLEMINGGWSMNDEAAAHYHSIIDQFTWGFRILEDTVGQCGRPKIGWQIDPFGHSREHASISKQLGFEGLVVGRIDYRDKAKRIEEKNLDFLWDTNDNFEDSQLFTTMFPDFYVYESGFCFDVYCNDEELNDSNIKEKVEKYTERLELYRNYYKTKNIMLPMGHDFSYQRAEKNFRNIDKLIEGFKDHETYNVIYSTPSCYIQAVKDEVAKNNIELTVKTDDFFPYASSSVAYWTGYFTSRPTQKRFERLSNNILQSAKQLTTFSRINGNELDDSILKLRMAMGVMQHHDAITGTEKQAVADDYTHLLSNGIQETEPSFNIIIGNLLKKSDSEIDLQLSLCLRANMSVCDTSKKDRFVVAIQNPLSKTVSHYVHLPVDGENYKITGEEEVQFDIFDPIHPFDFVNDGEPASNELVFLAKDLPPLGVKLYYVEKIEGSDEYHKFEDVTDQRTFGNEKNGFTISSDGKLSQVTVNGVTQDVQQDFFYYKGVNDYNSEDHRASGAYAFRPDGPAKVISESATVRFAKGSLVDEVHQVFSNEVTQIIRVHKGEEDSYIEFDWLIGDLQTNSQSKEVITRLTFKNFANNEIFYTDSNGRQQMERKRNYRSDYTYDPSEEPITSNYYPITSKIVIKDDSQKLQVAVLTDRAQGGSSLEDGQIELMVHRRETKDDGFGVDEVLNERQYGKGLYARGQHYLTFDSIEEGKASPNVFERDFALKKLLSPVVLLGDASSEDLTLEKVQEAYNFKFEALKGSLPDNVHILTLEPWKDSYLLRLEHIFENGEDETLSQDATVELKDLFTQFSITELSPISLGANENLETEPQSILQRVTRTIREIFDSNLSVTLKPMEIKTFVFKTDKQNDGGHNNGIVDP